MHKTLIQGFEGPDLILSIARTELADYEINNIKEYAAQLRSIKIEHEGEEKERVVPVIEEKLNVSKKIINRRSNDNKRTCYRDKDNGSFSYA